MRSTTSKPMDRARAYIAAHPDESKKQQALGADVSVRTIASARKEMIAEGLLAPDRKTDAALFTHDDMLTAADKDARAKLALAEVEALDDLNDEQIAKKLLKQCIRFALDPDLHPDTRMSASQQWVKLKDMTKSADRGPGPPMTRADAVARAKDMIVAAPDVFLDAFNEIMDTQKGGASEGKVPAEQGQAEPPAAGVTQPL